MQTVSEILWDCSGCWREFKSNRDASNQRFERTTVYQEDRVADAYVCPQCGGLLKPYLDEL